MCLLGDQADSLIPVSEHRLDRDQSIDASRSLAGIARRGVQRDGSLTLLDGVGPAALQRVRQTEDAVEVGRVAEYTAPVERSRNALASFAAESARATARSAAPDARSFNAWRINWFGRSTNRARRL